MKKFRFSKLSLLALVVFLSISVMAGAEDKKTETKELTRQDHLTNLKSGSKEQKLAALAFIREKKEKDDAEAVGSVLESCKDEEVRADAANTLGLLDNKDKARPFLMKAIKEDKSALVRYTAILAIVNLGDKAAAEALEYAHKNDTDEDIKNATATLIKKFKEE